MSNRTWKITVDEDELKVLINFNASRLNSSYQVDYSQRIHNLTKRLNKDEPEIEKPAENVKDVAVPAAWG
jgi:hypothetical protein